MGLRLKFNLMLVIVAVVGVALFAVASTPILQGLARGEVFTAEGELVCSVVQEGLIRTGPGDSGTGPNARSE